MAADLKKNVWNHVPQNYVALKYFLGGLKCEFVAPAAPNSTLLSMANR